MSSPPEDGKSFAYDVAMKILSEEACNKRLRLRKLVDEATAAGTCLIVVDKSIYLGSMLASFDQGENSKPGVTYVSNVINNQGGSLAGVAQGQGASVLANDITVFNANVDNSRAPADLKAALKQARADIEGWNPSDAEQRTAVLSQFDLFAAEAVKEKPNKHLLTTLWNGISSTVKTVASLTAFLKAGATVLAYFGIGVAPTP